MDRVVVDVAVVVVIVLFLVSLLLVDLLDDLVGPIEDASRWSSTCETLWRLGVSFYSAGRAVIMPTTGYHWIGVAFPTK